MAERGICDDHDQSFWLDDGCPVCTLDAENKALRGHILRLLYLFQGAWHPNSIMMQKHAHELEAARRAANNDR